MELLRGRTQLAEVKWKVTWSVHSPSVLWGVVWSPVFLCILSTDRDQLCQPCSM